MGFFKYIKKMDEQSLRQVKDFTELKCGKTHIAIKKIEDNITINTTDLLINMSINETKELINALQNALKTKK